MRTATLIPDNERWLLDRGAAADLQAAMSWSVGHPTTDTEVEQTFRRLGDDEA